MIYFAHATNDGVKDQINELRAIHGGAAIDAYWMIIERLCADEEPLPFGETRPEARTLSIFLQIKREKLLTYVATMLELGLLVNETREDENGEPVSCIWSKRVETQCAEIEKISESKRKNGRRGGRPKTEKNLQVSDENLPVSEKNLVLLNENLEKPSGFEKKPSGFENETYEKQTKTKTETKTKTSLSKERDKRETETANVSLSHRETNNEELRNSSPPPDFIPEVVTYLNETTGNNFRETSETRNLIKDRYNEGYNLDDFRRVIDVKTAQWQGSEEMARYLRPKTLFSSRNFENYVLEKEPQHGTSSYVTDDNPFPKEFN